MMRAAIKHTRFLLFLLGMLVFALTEVNEAQAAPTFQAAGTAGGGAGAVSPAWPAHQVGDVALLFVESSGDQAVTLSVPAGFVAVANSPSLRFQVDPRQGHALPCSGHGRHPPQCPRRPSPILAITSTPRSSLIGVSMKSGGGFTSR